MPKLSGSAPKYCRHKASGQAVVTLNGHDHYLGKFGSATSKQKYKRLVGEWMASGRTSSDGHPGIDPVTITEVCVDYLKKADGHYRKNGRHTEEFRTAKIVLRKLRQVYASLPALEFGPVAFKALRQRLVGEGYKRNTINHYLRHVIMAFRLAVENEKLPPSAHLALKAVEPLRKGRSPAPESQRIKPADPAVVSATLAKLPAVIADMARLQLLTAMRPSEVCAIRPADIDRTRDVWIYTPESHKTEHHGRPRIIPIGREGQAVLTKYLLRPADQFCFSPAESMEQIRQARFAARKTPLSCGNRRGTNRKRRPARTPGLQFDSRTYARSIRDACKRHGLKPWAPNQLRKLAATNIRRVCDLEAAQIILGHSSKAVTEAYYADPYIDAAVAVARQVG